MTQVLFVFFFGVLTSHFEISCGVVNNKYLLGFCFHIFSSFVYYSITKYMKNPWFFAAYKDNFFFSFIRLVK